MNKLTNAYNKEHMALVRGREIPISTKFSIEICKQIKNKAIKNAKRMLEGAVNKTEAISFVRYTMDLGHKRGGKGPGRYPLKASKHFLKMLNSLEANAADKGLDTNKLIICHASASLGKRNQHPGRHSGTFFKSTNLELRAKELEKKEETKK